MLTSQTEELSKKRTSVTPTSTISHKITYRITPEEMWQCVKGSSQNWGIEGYEIPKIL